MELLYNQNEAIIKLSEYKVGALFMEAGTGKTRTAYELIKSVNDVDYILWFTPFRTKSSLRREIDKCGGLSCDIIGIESIKNSDKLYLELHSKLIKAKKPFIIVDESLKIKNHQSKTFKRMFELSKMSEYKLILNGTPLSKNITDMWAQMQFLSPLILGMGYAEYESTFCCYTKITKIINGSKVTKKWISGHANVEYLYHLIEKYIYRCSLILRIDKETINTSYELSDEEKEEHEKIKRLILDNEWLMMKPNFFLEICQKLQNNYSRNKNKFHVVEHILKSNNSKKAIIFAKYIETQELLKKTFPNVLVLSYQKHSFGLNLQEYNRIIFFDKTWDYAVREQAEARIYRQGQNNDCIFYDLTANIGLDKMIEQNIYNKANMLEAFKKLSKNEYKNL